MTQEMQLKEYYESRLEQDWGVEFNELTFDVKLKLYKSMGHAVYRFNTSAREFAKIVHETYLKNLSV